MICVAWVGMGSYAQCALTQFIRDSKEKVTLIAITSDVPKICRTELAGVRDSEKFSEGVMRLIDML